MKWEPLTEGAPLNVVKLWGDPFKDGMLVKLPPGFTTGMHSHSAPYYTVELTGRKMHRGKDEDQSGAYTPGSFTHEVPGHIHEDVCIGPDECIVFLTQQAKMGATQNRRFGVVMLLGVFGGRGPNQCRGA